jgi:NADPH:quinone reductase-like Zn-dependent oxidoreductase
MKAVVWTAYGPPDVLEIKEVDKPTPNQDEVLVRIYASTVTAGDCEQRSLKMPFWYRIPMRAYIGFRKPERLTILGMDFAGEIEAVGKNAKLYQEGDKVFGSSGIKFGTNAEYICLPVEPEEGALAAKPANMSYEESAAVPVGGLEALYFLRQGNVQSGHKVLINGAGGTIGTFAVQLAKHFGAEVTGVDSKGKLDILRSIGADYVIDFTQEDFSKSGQVYDFILDVVSKGSFSGCIRSLKPNGSYLIANPGLSQLIRGRWTSLINSLPGRRTGGKVIFGAAKLKSEDLLYLKALIEAGKIKSVIDRQYRLAHTAEAHRYVETGLKKGNVVITVAQDSE